MASQNLHNISAKLKNGEPTHTMKFKLNGNIQNVTIIEINPDGSCLFGTPAHQLYRFKVGSEEHIQATGTLRAEAVSYILSNFEQFEFVLKDRVYETVNNK